MMAKTRTHGWDEEAIRNYGRKAPTGDDQLVEEFQEKAAALRERAGGDGKWFDVEWSRLCHDNDHLADLVPEIAERLAAERRNDDE